MYYKINKLIVGSNNKGKIIEIKDILGNYFDEIISLKEAGIDLNVVEDGTTFFENAQKKAKGAFEIANCATLADDSGLVVDALDGKPGVYSARFAGENATDDENNLLLLSMMKDVPYEKRTARFVCTLVLCLPDGTMLKAEGACEGHIHNEIIGENGFGYDSLFYLEKYGQTMAQIDPCEKNKISHRYKALIALMDKLNDYFKKNS